MTKVCLRFFCTLQSNLYYHNGRTRLLESQLSGFLFYIIYCIIAAIFLYLIYKVSSRKTNISIFKVMMPVSTRNGKEFLHFSILISMLFCLILLVFFAISTILNPDSRIVLIFVASAISVLFWLGHRNGAYNVH